MTDATTDVTGGAAPATGTEAPHPAIVCRDVHKWYGRFHALRGITTDIAEGETVVVFGPSGSAKSTFLRCLNRLEVHDSGEITIAGITLDHQVHNLAAVRRQVGMVFQHFHLFPHLTVRQNITLAPQVVRHMAKAEADARALRLLEQVGIPNLIDMYPSDLSGGQAQRVAIARALAMEPRVLLLDEPTSALDPESIRGILALLGELSDLGMTMVIVTHEMGFAREVADRLLFLEEGQVVEEGPPEQIFGHAQEERTRRFLSQIL
ncbi:MAG: amino acid ABC transporter ATP-binding protein [Dehalococcoidia bacterium]|nr:amino acid ABC transporter ATP-binding protein [Dehalococcoidia bacterium]